MTNGWIDIKNTDMMLIMGGNPAENHPCGFKWAMEAKRNRNAKLISVDPRFTRTSATADLFVQIRAGTDIAFLGGLIRYAIENNRIAKEYLVNYTNAAFIVKEGFKLPEDGLYSGFNAASSTYDKTTWNYEEGGELQRQNGRRGFFRTRSSRAEIFASPNSCTSSHTCAAARVAPECRLRPDASASALRLPIDEAAVFPLHPRNRRTDHGHPEGPIPEGCRSIYLSPQRWRHEESRDHHLRGGLDAAYFRNADHPHRRHDSTASRQRRQSRRWRERASRTFEYSGRDRHGRVVRVPARLPERTGSRRHGFGDVSEAHHARRRPNRRRGIR